MYKAILFVLCFTLLTACSNREEAPLESVNVNGEQGIKVDEDAEILDTVSQEEVIVGEDEVVVEEDAVMKNTGTPNPENTDN